MNYEKNIRKIGRPKKLALITLRVGTLVIVGLTVFLYFFQQVYLFQPEEEILRTPESLGLEFENVNIEIEGDTYIKGWYIPAADQKGVVLFCHSNYGNISYYLDAVFFINSLGFSILIFDYRGYGQSRGSPSEKGTYADVRAAWSYLRYTRNIPAENIIVWGRSLGAAIAADLVVDYSPRALVMESGFSSFPAVAKDYFPYVPVQMIARYDYNNLEKIKHADCPVMVVHSRDDEIIAFYHGQKIFKAANPPKRFLEINGSHNDCYFESGKKYEQAIKAFLQNAGTKQDRP